MEKQASEAIGNVAEDGDHYDYYTMVEIDGRHALPSDLATLRIPALRLARFAHRGHISTIRSTIGAIFDKRPMTPGPTSDGNFGFIEFTTFSTSLEKPPRSRSCTLAYTS